MFSGLQMRPPFILHGVAVSPTTRIDGFAAFSSPRSVLYIPSPSGGHMCTSSITTTSKFPILSALL